MTAPAYTEDQLVEQPAIRLFAELGWQTVSALEEIFGKDTGMRDPLPSRLLSPDALGLLVSCS